MQVKKANLRARIRRKRFAIFAACLLLATIFWFLNTSSNIYNAKIIVPVKYLNAGTMILDENELPAKVSVTLHGSGYDIFSLYLNPDKGTIFIDGNKIGVVNKNNIKKGFILMQGGLEYFNRQHATIRAIAIDPDTIFFELKNKEFKRVPIKANLDYSFHRQYGFMKPLEIIPDSVDISGEKNVIAEIHYVETEKFSRHNIQSSFQKSLKLLPIEGVYVNPSTVTVNFSVEQFTEQVLEVPIQHKKLKNEDSLILIPNKVIVTFMVALHDYMKVQSSDFRVEADVSKAIKESKGRADLELTKYPDYIRNPKISPEKVEYILMKNRKQK